MKKLELSTVPESEQQRVYADMALLWDKGDAQMRKTFPAAHLGEAAKLIMDFVRKESMVPVYRNDVYQVQKREMTEWINLSIRRIDREPIRDWRDMQEIKNQLLGAEVEAVELYPAESRLVDTANQYHLWAPKLPGAMFPFGFNDGRVVSEYTIGKSKQRPFDEKKNAG